MNTSDAKQQQKPLLRGHLHQAAFFIALGACGLMLATCQRGAAFTAALVYSLALTGLLGISSLYHRIQWEVKARQRMRRLDHAAIFVLIAGTGTPICLLSMPQAAGQQLLMLIWAAAGLGVMQSLFWVNAPKWVTAVLYVTVGWLVAPYIGDFRRSLSDLGLVLLIGGGALYTAGAVIYALKRPNPFPKVFGYHEIFHLVVVIAAALHFVVIYQLITRY